MDKRIVLGFPYSGAFYWLLSAEEHYNKSIKESYTGSHPYYITLFGKDHNSIIDETVSLTLLYDEIYLSPADSFLPDREKYHISDTFLEQDWGIFFNWHWLEGLAGYYNQTEVLLRDSLINNTLAKIPTDSKKQIIQEALNQIYISNKFDAPIFAIQSYLTLCERINEIINPFSNKLKVKCSANTINAINTVFDIASLNFSINALDEFAALKEEKAVRQYAQSFRSYIKELPNGNLDQKYLYEAMLQAMNNDKISSKIKGGFELVSSITGIISLLFNGGTVAGVIGLETDVIAKVAGNYSHKNKWWLLAPEISKQLTKKRIEELANGKVKS